MTELSPNTQLAVLLTARWAVNGFKPLGNKELSDLRIWMQMHGIATESLLAGQVNLTNAPQDPERLKALLNRGLGVFHSVDKWKQAGVWLMSWSDPGFPSRFKQLKSRAPMLLFGFGNPNAFGEKSLAIVGSRKASEERLSKAAEIGRACADQGVTVVSGGAKGVDSIAMEAGMVEKGTAVGVLADSLLKQSSKRQYRDALMENRLCLMSEVHPEARFDIGNAMARNRLAYACADSALVIECDAHSGGTWAGAKDALKEGKTVYVLKGAKAEDALSEIGAVAIDIDFAKNVRALITGERPLPSAPKIENIEPFLRKILGEKQLSVDELASSMKKYANEYASELIEAAIKDGWYSIERLSIQKNCDKNLRKTPSLFPDDKDFTI